MTLQQPAVQPLSARPRPERTRQPATTWLRRALVSGVAVAAVVGLGPALPGAAAADPAPACPDPTQPIQDRLDSPFVAVGTTKTKKLRLDLYTHAGCDVTAATATVRSPRATRTVTLTVVDRDAESVHWQGSLSISPKQLRNSDSGTWPTTYRITGQHPDSLTVDSQVVRAVRLAFNAGPEPVRNDRITYSGHLERASWKTRTYRDLGGRHVDILKIRLDEEDRETVAELVTRTDGTFRTTRPYLGPSYYQATYDGTRYTSAGSSRRDRVDTPR